MTFVEALETLKTMRTADNPYCSLSYRYAFGFSDPEVLCSAYINGQSFDGQTWDLVIAKAKAYAQALLVKPTLEEAP